jgi:CheY-like chemotaxis protein
VTVQQCRRAGRGEWAGPPGAIGPLLFVTGYVEQSEALHEQGTPVLLKPFSPDALLKSVAAAVAGDP